MSSWKNAATGLRWAPLILVLIPARAACQQDARRQPETALALCQRVEPQLDGGPAARYCAALRQNPESAADLNGLGIALARRKMYPEAIIAYQLTLNLHSHVSEVEKNLGIAYFKMGNFQRAIPPLRAAAALNPTDSQSRTLLGMAFYGNHDYQDAASELAKAAKVQPQNTRLLFVLAECYLWSRQPQKTLEVFQTIEEQQPDSAAAYMLVGQALDGLGRFSQAIEEFQRAARAAPNAPNVHFVLGYLYWKERKFDDAGAEFRRELARNPGNAEASAYLADVTYRHGDLSAARRLLRRARAEGAQDRLIYLDLGIIDTVSKDYAAAIAELRRAIALDPTQTDAHYRLALAYQGAGNRAAAERELATIKEMEAESRAVTQQEVLGQPGAH